MKLAILNIVVNLLLCVSIAEAADVSEIDKKEVSFPQNIVIEYNNEKIYLKRTGSTVRKKLFFKIYKMAHYVDEAQKYPTKNEEIYKTILQHNYAKQISTVYLRSIKAEKIKKSLLSEIKLNTNDDEYLQMLPQIDAFMSVINKDVKESDEFVLRWLPDGTIISLFQGEEISSIKDENFARTLWSIWFGRFSVVKRDTLVKELLSSS
jgi:hypothetical protein